MLVAVRSDPCLLHTHGHTERYNKITEQWFHDLKIPIAATATQTSVSEHSCRWIDASHEQSGCCTSYRLAVIHSETPQVPQSLLGNKFKNWPATVSSRHAVLARGRGMDVSTQHDVMPQTAYEPSQAIYAARAANDCHTHSSFRDYGHPTCLFGNFN